MTPDKNRRLAFKIIAISFPFIVVVLLEILLRLFHYGYSSRLFIEDTGHPGYVHTNIHFSRLFFSNNQDARLGIQQSFRKTKAPESIRIFVLGESSAYGYPYTPRVSFPRLLEERLSGTFRDRDIEIINLSITAINSYAFLFFAGEIIEMNPDAILIYAGHNEYYGAMGVGSEHGVASNRKIMNLVVHLKMFRISQCLLDFSGYVGKLIKGSNRKNEEGFMYRMAREQKIAYDSDLYNKGIERFRTNMNTLFIQFSKHGIPVYFSNLVSNDRGQKPFISILNNSTDTAQFFREFRKGQQAFRRGLYSASVISFLACNSIDSTYAMNHYLMGEACYRIGDYVPANICFSKARELDALRFRAPDEINLEIRHLSSKYSNIHFVDALKTFKEHSPEGILDNSLFLDHLHPNVYGYFLLADAFYNSMKTNKLNGTWKNPSSLEEAWKDVAVTDVDSVYGTWMSIIMKEQWPFYEHVSLNPASITTYPEKLTLKIFRNQLTMDLALDSLFRFYIAHNDLNKALKVVKSVYFDSSHEWRLASQVANLYGKLLNFEEALYYYQKSFKEFPDGEAARKIVFNLLQLDRPEEAVDYLKFLTNEHPEDKMTNFLLKQTQEVTALKILQLTEPNNSNIIFGLAGYYLYIQKAKEAKKYIDQASAKFPHDAKTVKLIHDYERLVKTAGTKNGNLQ